MVSVTILAAVIAMAPLVSSYHFKITLQRYAHKCKDPVGKAEQISSDDHKCKTWDDGISFDSYDYTWNNHFHWGEEIEQYGYCEIQFWEGTHCSGRYLGQLENANSKSGPGNCYAGFADAQGVEGRARSGRVLCQK